MAIPESPTALSASTGAAAETKDAARRIQAGLLERLFQDNVLDLLLLLAQHSSQVSLAAAAAAAAVAAALFRFCCCQGSSQVGLPESRLGHCAACQPPLPTVLYVHHRSAAPLPR